VTREQNGACLAVHLAVERAQGMPGMTGEITVR
jgi:hypothetical protein